jgi:hypothetical protein
MTTFLTDDAGDIYIDPQGQLKELDGVDEVRQRIVNLFSTQKGSEIFAPEYGYDRVAMVRAPLMDDETSLHYYVMEALNPQNLYGISAVYNIQTNVDVSGTDKVGFVSMELQVGNIRTGINLNIGTD